ncbi:hypothetical protein ABZ934_14685 [Streptomyces sp. NPDC046557]|uniref:hypothetical protein n=1 Tax=Streptomyces sp. NPDC046557 TaxID=3155372 RepID=UPI0033E285AD
MLVDEYGTRHLRTQIFTMADGRFLWRRRHLAGGTAGATAARGKSAEQLGSSRNVASAAFDGDTVTYTTPGAKSLARIVWPPSPVTFPPGLVMSAIGHALRDINGYTGPLDASGPPPALERLSQWLRGGRKEEGAARLHRLCTDRLGPTRLNTLVEWCHGGSPGTTGEVLLHGEPSLGLTVPDPDGRHAVLLTGESLSRGRPEHDAGWLLGELAEMADVESRNLPSESATSAFKVMAKAFLAGRGHTLDGALLCRSATLRRMAHLVDFAGNVGWSAGIAGYVDILAALIDEDGQTVFSPLELTA